MDQTFLYLLEVKVEDLIVSRPNELAPVEFPTCITVCYRNKACLSLVDKEPNDCCPGQIKNKSKASIFALEKPVEDEDTIVVEVSRRRVDTCRFIIGRGEVAVKEVFEKISEEFLEKNKKSLDIANFRFKKVTPSEPEEGEDENAEAPKEEEGEEGEEGEGDSKEKGKGGEEECNLIQCYEYFCPPICVETYYPTFESFKRAVSLTKWNIAVGNAVLMFKLACLGPQIMATLPLCPPPCPPECPPPPCPPPPCPPPSCCSPPCPPPGCCPPPLKPSQCPPKPGCCPSNDSKKKKSDLGEGVCGCSDNPPASTCGDDDNSGLSDNEIRKYKNA